MIFQWHITNRCNLRCLHCYQTTYDDVAELSLAQIEEVLEQFADFRRQYPQQGSLHLTITGGEPFLFPHIDVLIEKVSQSPQIKNYSLLSNGHCINAATLQLLKKYPPAYVQISLDGTKKNHEAIRGAGSFDKAVQGIKQLVAAKIRTTVSFTATKKNYKDFLRLSFLCNRLNINHLWTDRVIPDLSDKERLSLGPVEVRKYLWLLRLAFFINLLHPVTQNRISAVRALQFLALPFRKPYRCSAGRNLLAIMPDGDVYPCRRMERKVGNLFESSLSTIYISNYFLVRLREDYTSIRGCEGCKHERICRGGLKCLALAENNDPFTRDPGCCL
ncbi:radical SAM protein [Desulfobulbus sp. TB]|nr:radical SAM protein [Desulfobulbus sp. TB]